LQWTALAVANAVAAFSGAWLQQRVEAEAIPLWVVFSLTAMPPLLTAFVGWRNIDEKKVPRRARRGGHGITLRRRLSAVWSGQRQNRTIMILTAFLFFWKFSPSVGYIQRSYLIDVRGFEPASFGSIISAGSISFLASLLVYRWIIRRFPGIPWYHYLYAMVGLAVLSFPLTFFLYLEADHPWWAAVTGLAPQDWALPRGWNRYEAFRVATEVFLSFATTPALMIPLTIAGETVKIERAGVGYAFLMAFANVTNMFEGMVGAALYRVFTRPEMDAIVAAFASSPLNVAHSNDERTLILQIFVYISLLFTLLTLPFLHLLRRELDREKIAIDLAGGNASD
jgi:hypothetical protein